ADRRRGRVDLLRREAYFPPDPGGGARRAGHPVAAIRRARSAALQDSRDLSIGERRRADEQLAALVLRLCSARDRSAIDRQRVAADIERRVPLPDDLLFRSGGFFR